MKKFFLIFLLTLSSSIAISQDIKRVRIEDVVKMIDTSTTPIVINFWASWCKPCIHELTWFEKIVADHKEKGVKLVLVSLDFSEDFKNKALHKFVKKTGYTSKVVWLDETNADKFCPPIDSAWGGSIPATLMVNNKKSYRQFFEFQLKEERFKQEIEKLVE
jgi:thiol-disulfide isomerase/thioredoxin